MPGNIIKPFRWNIERNQQLQADRKISFEAAVLAISEGKVLDVIEHPNPGKIFISENLCA